MPKQMHFDYYYGIESEQFAFYRLPRLLVKDERFKGLSSDSKILYGLLLDRMALSRKNGWIDEHDRAYIIYSVEDMMSDLGCSKPTCIKAIKELDREHGIGLVERVRRGLGRPDIIYVKNFATLTSGSDDDREDDGNDPVNPTAGEITESLHSDSDESEKEADSSIIFDDKQPSNPDESTEVKNLYFKKSNSFTSESKESLPQEVKDLYFSRSKSFTSASKESLPQQVKDFYPNYNNNNHTDSIYTDINHINRSGSCGKDHNHPPDAENGGMDVIDRIDEIDEAEKYMCLIRKNIDYDNLINSGERWDREMYEEMYQMICDIVCVRRKQVRINGENYPYEAVKSRFLKLTGAHLEYVRECMKRTVTRIGNIRAYLLTSLYMAPETMNHYYQQEVNHDMYGDV